MGEVSLQYVLLGGAAICGVFIAIANQLFNFCTFCAVRDIYQSRDTTRLRTWAIAVSAAIVSVQLLGSFVDLRLNESIYLSGTFGWAGAIIGGLLFGIGMALTRSCAFSLVTRTGSRDLRALVALFVMAFSAYMAARGLTGLARVSWIEPLAIDLKKTGGQSISSLAGEITGIAADSLRLPIALAMGIALAAWSFGSHRFRPDARSAAGGILVGLTVAFAFFLTGYIGNDDFEPARVEGLSFVMPAGDTLIYFMTFTGASLNFGIALILGTLFGAFAITLIKGDTHWRGFISARETGNYIAGAFFMGLGGVTSLGCTIGQGVTGMASLSASAPMALAAIIVGGLLGQRLSGDAEAPIAANAAA